VTDFFSLQRENTLLKEFEASAKSSAFHDRRIGERDDSLPEFDKAILRQQRERLVRVCFFLCDGSDGS
jgi:nucleolar protein 14